MAAFDVASAPDQLATQIATTKVPELIDPKRDGWDSEAVSNAIQQQLNAFGNFLVESATDDADKLASLVTADVNFGPLRPHSLTDVFQDETMVVRRADEAGTEGAEKEDAGNMASGAKGLAEELGLLTLPLQPTTGRRYKFKIVRVEVEAAIAKSTAYFQISGRSATDSVQQKATWHCRWILSEREAPRLASIRVENYEEVVIQGSQGPWFADRTQAILGHNWSFRAQLAYGLNHWTKRIERYGDFDIYSRNGLAVGDADGDGLDDVYICQPGGLPNRLYTQNSDGTATDVSTAANVDWLNETRAALFVDLDNDGDQDLVLATEFGLKLLENDGAGKFRFAADLPEIEQDVQSITAVDYDNDGDLDLYACVYFDDAATLGESTWFGSVYDERSVGGANRLFSNKLGNKPGGTGGNKWDFDDVTQEVGLDSDNRRYSLAAAWEDYDNDGDQDLYIANDFGRNCLYRNDAGVKEGERRFVSVADQAGVVDYGPGMSVSWADYNRDGYMDLYVGNMFSSAGSRLTRQSNWVGKGRGTSRDSFQRFSKGNSLYQNLGGQSFREVSTTTSVEIARWSWSSLFADINNDSWEDLLVANGYITGEGPGDL
ncbi:MAG: VCBS repeat-containing protein [Pirellulales bacterium]